METTLAANGRAGRGRALPVAWSDGAAAFQFTSAFYTRHYGFQTEVLTSLDPSAAGLLQQMRAINSRNLLTVSLLRTLGRLQRAFLETRDPLTLNALALDELAVGINADPRCPIMADASRLSRLMRHLALGLADGEVVMASALCPRPRELHRRYVDSVVRTEQTALLEHVGTSALSDDAIAMAVLERFGMALSRRTVANVRRDLGIPCSRQRGANDGYLGATHGFSPLHPLAREVVHTAAPTVGGVYELHARGPDARRAGVIYIGSAGDLRKRLMDHLRGAGTNTCLAAHIADGRVWFRYRQVVHRWRETERQVYRAFRESFGDRPACNRMSP
ncbi:hypothetical protein [Sulfurivermis fontis]|uniref:RNA polymerase factor sigma-54 n=1 Tax=Sulfurivermis fontis TaxID=1972068 RepID=UPI001559ADCE|nr:hypothetical protein [Sulfurivermis fontis]